MTSSSDLPHLIQLGHTRWRVWRECALRSAGFPAAKIEALCDEPLADVARRSLADSAERARFMGRWPAAVDRSQDTARSFARDPRFREAVTWQNPSIVRNCLDVTRLRRKHELTIVSYVQRYLLKNDTIGFFGPLAWAHVGTLGEPIRVVPGPRLVAERLVFFETWVIDTVADLLARSPGIEEWLRPRLVASALLDGTTLYRSYGPPLVLATEQARLLYRCDGRHTVSQLAAELARPLEQMLPLLRDWRDDGLIHLGFDVPVSSRPEVALRQQLTRIGHAWSRQWAMATLNELVAARDAVAGAAGDSDAVAQALANLASSFEKSTGRSASRRAGESYAGRTLVYEDTRRDVHVELGRPVFDRLAAPLSLLLDSADWLVPRAADHYEQLLAEVFDRCAERVAPAPVPLAMLVAAATPYLRGEPPLPVARAVAEFQQRWARVLHPPPEARGHTVSSDSIAEHVQREFPVRPARWAAAVHHSPDLLIATAGAPPYSATDLTLVLGELHLARNTLENRPLVEFHDQPDRLLAAIEADHGARRIYHVPPKAWPQVSPRTYPSPLLSPRFTYWCLHDDTTGAPGEVLPAAALTVHRNGDLLRVKSRRHGLDFSLLEVVGEQLSNAVVNAFQILPGNRHRPRITIDNLVAQRESWAFNARDLGWAQSRDRAERFRLAQAWQATHHLPNRAFYKILDEKPTFVDFRSVGLVELLARTAQRVATSNRPGSLRVTEMLPDLEQSWLTDADGDRYTAEVRCVVTAPDHTHDVVGNSTMAHAAAGARATCGVRPAMAGSPRRR